MKCILCGKEIVGRAWCIPCWRDAKAKVIAKWTCGVCHKPVPRGPNVHPTECKCGGK